MMLKHVKSEEFNKQVLNNERATLVDFYATWCGPCKMLAPVLEKVANSRAEFDIVKVNIEEEQDLAMKYGIETVPTMLVFKNGKLVDRLIGYVGERNIVDVMSKHI